MNWWGLNCGMSSSCGRISGISEDNDRNLWQACVEFGDECGPADALHGVGGDYKAQFVGELRLLNEAEGLGCIGNADYIQELPLQNRFPQKPMKRIAFHD